MMSTTDTMLCDAWNWAHPVTVAHGREKVQGRIDYMEVRGGKAYYGVYLTPGRDLIEVTAAQITVGI